MNSLGSGRLRVPGRPGKKTGPHGACLTHGYAAHGRNTLASRLEETRFWGRAIRVIAGGECRERERRKAAARPQAPRAALCADMDGTRLSALRFPV